MKKDIKIIKSNYKQKLFFVAYVFKNSDKIYLSISFESHKKALEYIVNNVTKKAIIEIEISADELEPTN